MEIKYILTFILICIVLFYCGYVWLYKKRLEYKYSQICILKEIIESQEYKLLSQFIDKQKQINAVKWLHHYYGYSINRSFGNQLIDCLFDEHEEINLFRNTNIADTEEATLDWQVVFDFIDDIEIIPYFFKKK